MSPGTPYVDPTDLVVGGVYKLRSRNLLFGVWDGSQFIGMREKLGSRFLFGEAPNTYAQRGTVTDASLVTKVPEGMDLSERGGTQCQNCRKPAAFKEWTFEESQSLIADGEYAGRGRWICSCEDWRDSRPAAMPNTALTEFMERVESLSDMA